MSKIPVIYYHDVVSHGEGYSYQKIEEKNFEAQMEYLYNTGYKTVKFSEILANSTADYSKCIVITFDDGFKGVIEKAVPILKKYGFTASVFVATGLLNTNGLFSEKDAVEFSEDGVLELCAHTNTHLDMRFMDKDGISKEFYISNKKLTHFTGISPRVFCIPFGAYNKKVRKSIFMVGGYDMVFASFNGFLNTKNFKGKLLPRIGIKNEDSLKKFANKVKGKYNIKGILQKIKYTYNNIFLTKYKFDKDGL